MMHSELDAIREFIRGAEALLPYCNDDCTDTLQWLLDGVRDRLRSDIAELEAQSELRVKAMQREIHEQRVRERGLRVVKGGKR